MKKIFSTSVVATLIVGLLFITPQFLVSETKANGIRISGSNSMYSLMKKIVAGVNDNSSVQAEIIGAKGSATGIKDLIDQNAEIAMSSRAIKKEEMAVFEPLNIKVKTIALDPIAVIVHKTNQVKNLTKQQLQDIYLGKIKNWQEVGGSNQKIIPVARPSTSGTREAFDDLIGIKKGTLLATNTIEKNETGESKMMVNENAGVIAYVALHAADQTVNAVAIDNIEPTISNVQKNKYTLSRPFVLAYRVEGEPFIKEVEKEYVETIIVESKYVLPPKEEK